MDTAELKRRKRERITVLVLFIVLVIFTAVEIHLLRLSSKLPFVNSIFFFGLMNLNIVLIMVMLFLVFRNAVKLILDERRGKLGSRLKTRLVFCFISFAIIPTILLFAISATYIRSSFDRWFHVKVEGTLQKSIDVVKSYYQNTEKNGAHFAGKVAASLSSRRGIHPSDLDRYRREFGLDALEYYATPVGARVLSVHPDHHEHVPEASLETLRKVFSGPSACWVHNIGSGELVRCPARLGASGGVVFANYFIPLDLASQLEEITLTHADFQSGNPLDYPIKSVYFAILSMVTLLILFAATWTGFYVARRLIGPIEKLSKGTEEVAHGNLDYVIPKSGTDELNTLIHSFNKMTRDLRDNKHELESTNENLKKINDELYHRRRYIEVLLESVHSGVVSLDGRGRVSMVNSAAISLLKLDDDIVGKPYWALLPEEYKEEFRDLLAAIKDRTKPIRKEIRIRNRQNESVAMLVTLSSLRREESAGMGVVAVFDDVTDIQKMERMLAWREVAKRIAHEIKNPLTPIQLSVQRLRKRYLDKIDDDGTFDEATGIVLTEVASLKALVSEFSSFARLPESKPSPDHLNSIVFEAVNLYRAAHEHLHFELKFCDALPPMDLDRPQLKRALINLFDNAVAAMEKQGSIEVKTDWDKALGLFRIEVVDEGCGIDESAYSRLFEPHFSTKEGGTGLGLAIVHRIVTDHGGFVRVSANEPRGTRFVLEFPETLGIGLNRSRADESAKPAQGEPPSQGNA